MAAKISLEVIDKSRITQKVYFVTFRPVDPPTVAFKAGQNMMLMIAPGINRTMSIASAPSASDRILMIHDVSPMGPGSKWTLGLSVGDKVTIVAPTGGALMFLDTPKRKVMVATGTGVAPFHSMILDRLARDATTPLVLYWGQRFEEDVYWKEEFDRIATEHPNFSWHQILSRPSPVWNGLTGHVTEHVMGMEKDQTAHEYYLCGNKAMVEEVRAKLIDAGVPAPQIKTELFY